MRFFMRWMRCGIISLYQKRKLERAGFKRVLHKSNQLIKGGIDMLEIDGSKYLGAKLAAYVLGLSVETLRRWRYLGRNADSLPHFKRFDGKIHYKKHDVEALQSNFVN